ncbi:MAG: penicillin-binding protein 2 [Caldiserica bacterium]|nr:penicillin-binding protein 2 [Caldisericota bacterium]
MIPYRGRFFWLVIFLPFLYLLLILRLFQVQILQQDFFFQKARKLQDTSITITPQRGEIVDRNGIPLAMDRISYSVFYRPISSLPQSEKLAKIASLLGYPEETLSKKLTLGRFVYLRKSVDPELVKELQKYRLKGIEWKESFRRFYPSGPLAAPILGFVGKDRRGLYGVELFYDRYLKGEKGIIQAEKDGRRRILPSSRKTLVRPQEGYRIKLTLDEKLQYILEDELSKTHKKTGARASVGILLNPQTGEILAMASYPSFDPNRFWESSPSNYKNRAISMVYEPGSTFKVITMASALEEGVISPGKEIFCENGNFTLYNRTIHDHEPYGWLSVKAILWHSSNIGMTKIGMKLGEKKLYTYIRKFGFGEKTGIDLPGEEKGILRPYSKWSRVSIASIPYGQEIGVTPLQLVMGVAAVINGGYLLKPYIVKEIERSGESSLRRKKEVVRQVISSRTSEIMREMMVGVVERGTGRKAQISGYSIGGKTGTAQKYVPGKGYNSGKYTASFIGFLPASHPELLLLIVIDEPKTNHYGGEIAAPCFKRVIERVLCYWTPQLQGRIMAKK